MARSTDILADILFIIAATYATDGADALVATDPPAAVAIMRAFGRVISWLDTPLIEGVAFVAAEEAIGIWEARVNLQLRDHPQGEAIVEQDVVKGVPGSVVNVTPEYLKQELGANVYQTLKDCGTSDQDIQNYINTFKKRYVIDMADVHPTYCCLILKELLSIEKNYSPSLNDPGTAAGLDRLEVALLEGGEKTTYNNGAPPSTTFQGAFFQMQWIYAHENDIAAVEPIAKDNNKGPDVIMNDGSLVDFKSSAPGNIKSAELLSQYQRFRRLYGKNVSITFVFDRSKFGSDKFPNKSIQDFLDIVKNDPNVHVVQWSPPVSFNP